MDMRLITKKILRKMPLALLLQIQQVMAMIEEGGINKDDVAELVSKKKEFLGGPVAEQPGQEKKPCKPCAKRSKNNAEAQREFEEHKARNRIRGGLRAYGMAKEEAGTLARFLFKFFQDGVKKEHDNNRLQGIGSSFK